MSNDRMRGHFVWYDLMTIDLDAAIKFYGSVFGWSAKTLDDGDHPYIMWMTGDDAIGGLVRLDDEAAKAVPPHWLAYTTVPDTDAAAEKADHLGGQVLHGPVNIPDVGRFAVLADPQDAVFSIFTPSDGPPGPSGKPQHGHFSWHELATTDYEAATAFYAELFGWEVTEDFDMGEDGIYRMYGHGDTAYGGIYNKSAERGPGAPLWLHYIRVNDINEAAKRVEKGGGKVLSGPMEVPGGDYVAQCLDPQRAAFALHSESGG